MTVYVDDMYLYPIGRFTRNGRQMRMSHMMADTSEELLAMADAIGVARQHIQHAGTPSEHFDISMQKRTLAVRAGAVQVTMREMSAYNHARRRGEETTPVEAYKARQATITSYAAVEFDRRYHTNEG